MPLKSWPTPLSNWGSARRGLSIADLPRGSALLKDCFRLQGLLGKQTSSAGPRWVASLSFEGLKGKWPVGEASYKWIFNRDASVPRSGEEKQTKRLNAFVRGSSKVISQVWDYRQVWVREVSCRQPAGWNTHAHSLNVLMWMFSCAQQRCTWSLLGLDNRHMSADISESRLSPRHCMSLGVCSMVFKCLCRWNVG